MSPGTHDAAARPRGSARRRRARRRPMWRRWSWPRWPRTSLVGSMSRPRRRSRATSMPSETSSPAAPGVVAGLDVAEVVLEVVTDGRGRFVRRARTGTGSSRGDVVTSVEGRTRDLLTGERTALNLLCHLSGVATLTRRWVDAVEGTAAPSATPARPRLCCGRSRSTPCAAAAASTTGWRCPTLRWSRTTTWSLPAGSPRRSTRCARCGPTCRSRSRSTRLDQLERGRSRPVLTWCFSTTCRSTTMREAVRLTAGRARLEASGGLTLDTARAVAETGVDFIAVGALTHSAPVLDIALDLRPPDPGDAGVDGLMLLAIDVGNTNTVLGLFREERLVRSWRVQTDPRATGDEMLLTFRGLLHGEPDITGSRCAPRCPRCCARCASSSTTGRDGCRSSSSSRAPRPAFPCSPTTRRRSGRTGSSTPWRLTRCSAARASSSTSARPRTSTS